MSYHINEIKPGVFGELSKVREEMEEALDAAEQNNPLMVMQELSDMIGAIEAHAAKHNFTLQDLITMKEATARAFKSGGRKPKSAEGKEGETPKRKKGSKIEVSVSGPSGSGKSSLLAFLASRLSDIDVNAVFNDLDLRSQEATRTVSAAQRLHNCNPTVLLIED